MADRDDADTPVDGGTGTDATGPHATHDLERIAALLDADLAPADRMVGESMAAACPECAGLLDDLVAIAGAAVATPGVGRTRDFRLTPADAARLAPVGWGRSSVGEPPTDPARLTDDMFDHRITAGHPTHDTMLVAALVDHSIPIPERDAAQRMVETCRLCAELHADLLALRTATRALPTPPRPRDYFVSAADAQRLRPSGLRRWIAAIGGSRDAITRPLAIGLTTLGIVGLLVSGAPLLSVGSATSSARGGPAAAEAPAPAASQPAMDVAGAAPSAGRGAAAPATGGANAAAAASPGPAQSPPGFAPAPAGASAAPVSGRTPTALLPGLPPATSAQPANGSPEFLGDQSGGAGGANATAPSIGREQDHPVAATGSQPVEPETGVPAVLVVSGLLFVAGLGLFLLRWMARRVGA